jgi:HD superfamily phosphohydrolase YqeK
MNSIKDQIIKILVEVKRPGMDKLIKFLEESDFFTAPASTKYHGSYEEGLSEHSLNVFTTLSTKNDTYNLGLDKETIAITALLHDVCKINFYKKGIKNVKEGKKINWKGQEVDNWIEKEVWEVEDKLPFGHGEKSVIIVMRYIELTDLEIAMIRWHMGAFDNKDNLALQNAMNMWPQVVAMHTADLEASYIIESKEKDELIV